MITQHYTDLAGEDLRRREATHGDDRRQERGEMTEAPFHSTRMGARFTTELARLADAVEKLAAARVETQPPNRTPDRQVPAGQPKEDDNDEELRTPID